MKRILLVGLVLLSTSLWAQNVNVLKDINTGTNTSGSSPSNFTNVGGVIFFTATDPERGTELWKTDGTSLGTVVVKDINQGSGSSSPSYLTVIQNPVGVYTLYFAANDGINGTELWKSDGTANGTVIVRDIYSGTSSSSPQYIVGMGNNIYFSADNGSNGRELWKSDGTFGNTVQLTEIYAGTTGSNPAYLTHANGTVYFRATNSANGTELFKTTGGAPSLVEDLYSGASNNSNPFNFIALNAASSSIVFFSAFDATNGQELWRSDGTAAGTYVVSIYQVITGIVSCGLGLCVTYDYSGSSSPDYFTTTGTNVFFAATSSTAGREVFRHDGTTLTLVQDFVASGDLSPQHLTNVNGTIFFSGSVSGDRELYKATTSAVSLVSNINASSDSNPSDFEAGSGSTVYFSATHASDGTEFYSSNGTTVSYISNINPGASSSSPTNKAFLLGQVYLSAARDTDGRELFLYNGSSTTQLKDINGGTEDGSPYSLFNTGTTLYFGATASSTGAELWKSDGTTGGTVAVADINVGTTGSFAMPFGFTNSLIHFSGYTEEKGSEFYVSNGSSGNFTLREVNTSSETGSDPAIYGYATLGSDVYFTAFHPTYGYELWKSTNGAAATLVTDLYSGATSSYPQNLTVFGSFVYFTATDDVDGNELYRTSGSGATLIQDLNISGSSNPSGLCVVGSTLYWSADNGSEGYELFKTTGTGATMVKTGGINPGSGNANPQFMTNVNGTLFFRAIDGTSGAELWKSDGTSIGTVLVKDINPSAGSDPSNLTAVGSTLYFAATESAAGTELYKSDGTLAGTVLVKDIFSGTSSSSPSRLKNINGTLYFRASNGAGLNLMKTNGTSSGTIVATSALNTYQGVDDIQFLIGNVYWVGTTNAYGKELLYVKAEPINQPASLTANTPTANSINLSWPAAAAGCTGCSAPTGYIVIRNAGSSPTGLPADGPAPAINSSLVGTGQVAYVGTGLSFTDTGLSSSTTYHYRIYSYNDGGSSINIYKPHSPPAASLSTLATNPTSQPSAVFTSNVTTSSITVNWTNGNGSERIVLARATTAVGDIPVDGTAYTGNSNFSTATTLGSSKIVYRGSNNSVVVTSLASGTLYNFAIFELNGSSTQTNYLTSIAGSPGSATTAAADGNQPSDLGFSAVGTNTITLAWTAATAPATIGYIVTRRAGSDPLADPPVNMSAYSVGSTIGSSTVVYNSTGVTFIDPINPVTLSPGTVYFYRVYAKTAATTYVTANPLFGARATLVTEPTGSPGSLSLTLPAPNLPTSSSLSGGFTAGTGATFYVVLQKEGSGVSPDAPADGETYAVGNIIGSSTVVYVGPLASLPFTATGLNGTTVYHYAAFSAAGSGPATNYKTTSPSVASRTTLEEDPVDQPSGLVFGNLTETSFDVSFTSAPTPPTGGYIVLRKAGSAVAPPDIPLDGTAYAIGASTGGTTTVAYVGTETSFSESGLSSGVTYHYAVASFNGTGATTNYLLTSPASGSQATPATEPTAQPTALGFTTRTQTSLTLSFSAASGTPSGYLILRNSGSAPTSVPVDGVDYGAGGLIGSDAIVYVGASLGTVDDNFADGLVEGTQYFYSIFSYNGGPGTYNYRPTAPLQGNAFTIAAEPTDHPINIAYSNPTTTSMTVAFDEPVVLPAGYLVLRRTGAAPTGTPVDGTTYSAGGAIGDGTIVYIGAIPSFTATGLTSSTIYHFTVFPFNGTATSSNFLTVATGAVPPVPVLTGNRTSLQTEPASQPFSMVFSNKTTSSVTVGMTPPADATAQRFILLRKEGTAPTEVPSDGVVYAPGTPIGGSVVVDQTNIAGLPFNDSGLTAGATYHYAAFGFNGISGANNYLTTNPLTGSVAIFATAPVSQPTALVFSSVTGNSLTGSFTAAAGSPSGYLVVRKSVSSPTSTPASGTFYNAGDVLGDGVVVYSGANPTFNDTGLTPEATYYYHVYSFNGSGATTNYLTVSPLGGNQLTLAAEAAQPTGLSQLAVTTTSLSFNFTESGAQQYLILRKAGSAPTEVPVDGTAYTVGTLLGTSTIVLAGTVTFPLGESTLTPGTTYHYVIFAFNGSTTSTYNYNTTAPLTGSITTVPLDVTPPTFTNNNTPATVGTGLPLKISYVVADAESGLTGPVSLEFKALTATGTTFTSRAMTLVAGNYEADVTAVEIGEQGLIYRLNATNGHGAPATSANFRCLVSFPSLDLPEITGGIEQTDYKIIAVPLALTNNKGDKVFESLGSSDDGKRWRMYQFQNGGNTNIEITNLASVSVEPGRGYWLISKEPVTLNVGGGIVVDVTDTAPFTINLVPGWNLIGNPYLFNVSWADVNTANSTQLQLKTYRGGFNFSPTLNRYEGAFVDAGDQIALRIPPTAKATSREEAPGPKVNALDSDDWEVIISLHKDDQSNPFGGVGMSRDASTWYDYSDDFTVPRMFDYLELNHSKRIYGMTYTKDILPLAANHTWEFSVDANSAGATEMTWDNSYFGNNDLQLVLWDEEEQLAVDMRRNNSYGFDKGMSRKFRIFFGSQAYVDEKIEANSLRFHSIHPNPSSSDVRVAFSLPGKEASHVQVRVVNSLGQHVFNIFEGELEAGYHEVAWSGTEASGERPGEGIYVVEVISGGLRESKRLLIK